MAVMSFFPAPRSQRGLGLIVLAVLSVCLCIFATTRRDCAVTPLAQSPPGDDHLSCAASIDPYKQSAIKWRRRLGSAACSAGASVSVTGAWCLAPDPNARWPADAGRPAKNHVPADRGVGAGLVKYLGGSNHSLLDIGAGIGQYGRYLQSQKTDLRWFGYDGAENVEEFTGGFVSWTDATDETLDAIPFRTDFVMSLEVGEHVPPKTTEAFVKTLDRHNRLGIVLSWAIPRQGGLRHVNNMSNRRVVGMMKEYGYVQNDWCLGFQKDVRAMAEYKWFRNTFMVFVREHPLEEEA